MALSRRGALAIAGIATATVGLLGLVWVFAIPALIGLPERLWSDNLLVSGGMALVVMMTTGVVNVLFRLRWRRRRPAELPIRLLLSVLFGSFVAVGVAWAAALHRFPAPYGLSLALAHLGTGVGVSLLNLCLALLLLRSETVRQISGNDPLDEVPRLSWSRVGLRGYLLLVVLLVGAGTSLLLASYFNAQSSRESVAQRTRISVTLLGLMARRVERVPRARVLPTVGRAQLPRGYLLRVATRQGRFFRGRDTGRPVRRGARPLAAPLRLGAGGRCRMTHHPLEACRWVSLRHPHDDLVLVAQVWPLPMERTGRELSKLLLFAFVLTLFAAVVAYLMGRDVSQELNGVASRVQAMADRPEQGLGEPLIPTSSDEMGELLQCFAELRLVLEGQLASSAREVHRSTAVDRAKTTFLEEVNFALRTPLTAVIGFAELLQEGAFGRLRPDQVQEVQITLESSEQLLGLVQDIVEVSLAEAGGIQLRLESVDVAALVRSEVTTARAELRDDAVRLRHELPADLPPVVCDGVRVRRVLANLLSNAVKFTSSGEILVTGGAVDGGRVEVCVRDTGVGIPAEHQSLIFEQYRQAPQARPDQLRGSGLGLAIVQQLVRLHGGRVRLESAVGEGSAFFFSLPVEGPAPREDAESEGGSAPAGGDP